MKLIENEDPDSIVKKYGAKAFHNLLDNAKSFLQYLYELAQSKSILTRPAQKSKFIHYCLHLISTIPDKLQHIEFVQELADLLSLPYSQLDTLLKEKSKLEKEKVESAENIAKPDFSINITKQELELEEEQLISICLEFPEAFDLLKIKKFHSEQMITENGKLLFSILENHYGKDILNNILIDPEVPQEKKDYFVNLVTFERKVKRKMGKVWFRQRRKRYGENSGRRLHKV